MKRAKRILRVILEKAEVSATMGSDYEKDEGDGDGDSEEDEASSVSDADASASIPGNTGKRKKGGSTFASSASDSAKKAKQNAIFKKRQATRATRMSSSDVFSKLLSDDSTTTGVSQDAFNMLQATVQQQQVTLNTIQQQLFTHACGSRPRQQQLFPPVMPPVMAAPAVPVPLAPHPPNPPMFPGGFIPPRRIEEE